MTELYHLCDDPVVNAPDMQECWQEEDDNRETMLAPGASHPEQTNEYWLRKRWSEPANSIWNPERLLQRGNRITEALSTQIRANHSGPSKWDVFTGTHWQEHNTHDVVNALQEVFSFATVGVVAISVTSAATVHSSVAVLAAQYPNRAAGCCRSSTPASIWTAGSASITRQTMATLLFCA